VDLKKLLKLADQGLNDDDFKPRNHPDFNEYEKKIDDAEAIMRDKLSSDESRIIEDAYTGDLIVNMEMAYAKGFSDALALKEDIEKAAS